MKCFISIVLLGGIIVMSGCVTGGAGGKSEALLKDAKVRILSMDAEKRSMEVLKAAAMDDTSREMTSRFEATWNDDTKFVRTIEKKDFSDIKGPVAAELYGIREADSAAMKAGKPFEVRVAVILPDIKEPKGVINDNKLVVWFTPDKGDSPKSGTIELDGRTINVKLRSRFQRIFVREQISVDEVSTGYWAAAIDGKYEAGKILIETMSLEPQEDPVKSDDPALPRVLVVGDSISMNYHEAAKSELKGIANYHRIDGNSGSTADAVRCLGMWLGDYSRPGRHWDVIQFNSGLHDMKQKVLGGPYAVPIEQYKKNLKKEIEILKKTGAQLIWCSTTPVQNDSGSANYAFRTKGAEKEFNDAALEVVSQYPEIIINDLSKVVNESKVFDIWRDARDVHFYKDHEKAMLGAAVADAVKKALARRTQQEP